jgi:hypothetical protein
MCGHEAIGQDELGHATAQPIAFLEGVTEMHTAENSRLVDLSDNILEACDWCVVPVTALVTV